MDIPCSKWSSNKESTKLNLGHWYITASNIAYQYGMSPSRPDVFEPSLEMVGSVEFDPPPSPPSFKFAPGLSPGGFFIAKNLDGETRCIPLKPNSTIPHKVIR
jgi:hypothetical protein